MTENPWLHLPKKPPYVLAEDRAIINQFNLHATRLSQFELSLFPEPYCGRTDAPVVLLALDPGLHPLDLNAHRSEDFAALARQSLAHTLSPNPFLHLQEGMQTPSAKWWRKITARLAAAVGPDAVSQGLLCLDLFPYHAEILRAGTLHVPSQQYTFQLLRDAMARHAEIVILRSPKLWIEQVPELAGYLRVNTAVNTRNPILSPANLGEGFDILCERLTKG